MSNHQFTGLVLTVLCSTTALGGLLPDSGSNGYQYNRPNGGILGEPGRRVGYDASGRFLPSGNGLDSLGRPSGTYGAPGFGGFPGPVGYAGRPSGAYPGGYNGAFPGGVPPPGYEGIPGAYRNGYNGDDGPPRPYSFQYEVLDPPSGNDYGQQETSDGNVVRGEYRVLLPDSRTQIVKYTADDVNGYNADVQYEGQAQFPRPGGYQFSGPQGSYQPGIGFAPYQGRGGYGGPSVGGFGVGGANGNGIFGGGGGVGVGTSPSNQYLPPGGGYGK
ncbi:pro-resilin-like [Diachasma alloeum]|uniref:pro-resilin-like n=1 Tax=Diachasma alloeum TaxID=454923 RepID=UPI0007384670|nr:pro-resilin-like [Diachasma alloeum]